MIIVVAVYFDDACASSERALLPGHRLLAGRPPIQAAETARSLLPQTLGGGWSLTKMVLGEVRFAPKAGDVTAFRFSARFVDEEPKAVAAATKNHSSTLSAYAALPISLCHSAAMQRSAVDRTSASTTKTKADAWPCPHVIVRRPSHLDVRLLPR